MKSFKDYITEAKSVGILYHYTSIDNMIDIVKDDKLIQGRPEVGETLGTICFTRDKHFVRIPRMTHDNLACKFIIDGDKLSTRYKVEPYNWFKGVTKYPRHKPEVDEQEERVLGKNITQLSNYVIGLEIFLDEVSKSFLKKYNIESTEKFIAQLQKLVPYNVKYIGRDKKYTTNEISKVRE